MIDYTKFRLALKCLEEQCENHRKADPVLPEFIHEALAESVMHRFKICYDCLWRILKRYLSEAPDYPGPSNSPKHLFRVAHENDLLSSPLEQWLQYADVRISVSHDCDGTKAKGCLAWMPDFIGDAIVLYETMTESTWTTESKTSRRPGSRR